MCDLPTKNAVNMFHFKVPKDQDLKNLVAMSKDKGAAVDELSVGKLASLMHIQGCRNYTAVDSSRASRDLRDIRDNKVSSEARQQIRDDLQSFWSELRQLRRRPRHSGSPENHRKGRRRARRRRRVRSPEEQGAAHGRAASSGSESAGSGRHGRQRYSSSGSGASRRSRSQKNGGKLAWWWLVKLGIVNYSRWFFDVFWMSHSSHAWSSTWDAKYATCLYLTYFANFFYCYSPLQPYLFSFQSGWLGLSDSGNR